MSNKRQKIIEAIEQRLQTIQIANGYQTNIGYKVNRGRVHAIDYSDGIPFLFVGDVTQTNIQENKAVEVPQIKVDLFIEIGCFYLRPTETPPQNPHDLGRTIIADITKALFSEKLFDSHRVDYIDTPIDTEDAGTKYVSTFVNLKVNYLLNLCNP